MTPTPDSRPRTPIKPRTLFVMTPPKLCLPHCDFNHQVRRQQWEAECATGDSVQPQYGAQEPFLNASLSVAYAHPQSHGPTRGLRVIPGVRCGNRRLEPKVTRLTAR